MRINKNSLIAFLVMTAAACGDSKTKIQPPGAGGAGAKTPPMKVDVYVVQPETFGESIEVPGNILANEVTEIHPEVSG